MLFLLLVAVYHDHQFSPKIGKSGRNTSICDGGDFQLKIHTFGNFGELNVFEKNKDQ